MNFKADDIIAFWGAGGKNGIYSQWYKAPFEKDGQTFCCNEQYMMYHKAKLFSDDDAAGKIMRCDDPREIKALGRKVRHFDAALWDANKRRIVYEANYAKFTQNDALKKRLLDTGDKVLVEASPVDKIWGVGLDCSDERLLSTDTWRGQNLLGKAIMDVRDAIKAD